MEVLATLKAHDKKTGAYLGKAEIIAECCECENLDEFADNHYKDIAEYLYNLLTRKIDCNGVLFVLRFVELENEDDEELDEDEVINSFRRWF